MYDESSPIVSKAWWAIRKEPNNNISLIAVAHVVE